MRNRAFRKKQAKNMQEILAFSGEKSRYSPCFSHVFQSQNRLSGRFQGGFIGAFLGGFYA